LLLNFPAVGRLESICSIIIALCCVCSADTIHLKNGRKIVADSVHPHGDRLEYEVGDDTYAIPRSSVERIDTGGSPASAASSAKMELPQPQIDANSRISGTTFVGPWTPEALEQVENTHDPLAIASALLYAAREEQRKGKLNDAREHLERALALFPNDPTLLEHYVSVLLQSDRVSVAVSFAQQACREAPDSAEAHALLGAAYYKANRNKDAVAEWKKSLELKDDSTISGYLARAEREVSSETNYREEESSHFSLRYEGKQSSDAFRRQLLDTLEHHYNDLVSEIGILPRNTIAVVLYTNQAFFDVTHAPAWTAALNDGKLRMPVEGMESVTPELSRVLKHELAHSFVNQAARGKCPVWLNEGIAQMVEPQSAERYKRGLARLFKEGQAAPLASLNGTFMHFSDQQAAIAYAESLALTEYIRDTYGVSAVTTTLQRLNEGQNIDEALRSAIHSNEQQLQQEFAEKLIRDTGI
jgi:tetratricopeptide (TPR) repeat protein